MNSTDNSNEVSVAQPFRRPAYVVGDDGQRSRRQSNEELVPLPRSVAMLGISPPLPSTTDYLRRYHTEGIKQSRESSITTSTSCPPHIASTVKLAPAIETKLKHPWNVKKIPSSPPYPIERTHEILHDTSPLVIADRIAACLRDRSIGAVYDDDNATCMAEASDLTKFYIRLFGYGGSGSNNNDYDDNDDDGALLIEVQRRCGSCPTFHDAARVILRAARGLPPDDENRDIVRRPRSLPASLLNRAGEYDCISKRCCQNRSNDTKKGDDILGDLEVVNCLLHKDRLDAHLLAMESLRFLTDVESSGIDVATATAKSLLSDDEAAEIKNAVLSLIIEGTLDNGDIDSRDPHDCEIDVGFNNAMHDHALAVLANMIGLLTNANGGNKPLIIPSDSNELLSALSEDIANAESKPIDAYQASRCMSNLLASSDNTKLDAEEQGVLTLIEALQRGGICRHALMEKELDAAAECLGHVV